MCSAGCVVNLQHDPHFESNWKGQDAHCSCRSLCLCFIIRLMILLDDGILFTRPLQECGLGAHTLQNQFCIAQALAMLGPSELFKPLPNTFKCFLTWHTGLQWSCTKRRGQVSVWEMWCLGVGACITLWWGTSCAVTHFYYPLLSLANNDNEKFLQAYFVNPYSSQLKSLFVDAPDVNGVPGGIYLHWVHGQKDYFLLGQPFEEGMFHWRLDGPARPKEKCPCLLFRLRLRFAQTWKAHNRSLLLCHFSNCLKPILHSLYCNLCQECHDLWSRVFEKYDYEAAFFSHRGHFRNNFFGMPWYATRYDLGVAWERAGMWGAIMRMVIEKKKMLG